MRSADSGIVRILHMIGSLEVGGSQMMIINLYRAVDRTKIQFDFVIDHSDATTLIPEVEALGARVYTMPQFKGCNIMEVRRAWDQFFEEHPEYKILHSHVRSYASLYIPIAKKHGVKTIIHSHSTSNGKGISSVIKQLLQYPLRYQADYFFACTKEAGKWLFGGKIIRSKRFFLLTNGIDCGRFAFNESDRQRIRKEYGVEDCFVVGNVGRHSLPKNLFFLLDIFAEIYERDNRARLLQLGEGELTEQIKEKCCDYGIENAVILAGTSQNVECYYSAMDVFLFPSLWEGLPVTLVEAQASGLPCVVSDTLTREVACTPLVQYFPLRSSAADWADAVLKHASDKRKPLDEPDRLSDFDIVKTAAMLQELYASML